MTIQKKITETRVIRRRTHNGSPEKKDRLSKTKIMNALRRHCGIQTLVAKELGCSVSNIYQRIQGDPEIKEFYEIVKTEIVDQMEYNLIKDILSREDWENMGLEERKFQFQKQKYFMDHKARDRGYGEQAGKHTPGPQTININFVPATGRVEPKEVEAHVEFEEAKYEDVEE